MDRPFSIWQSVVFSLVFLSLILSGCTTVKYSLYNCALGYEHWKANLDEKTCEWNGRPISYLENKNDGIKENIVMVHGYAANKENWVRFAAYLTHSYHVVAIDLPGHGESVKDLNMSYEWHDQVHHLHEILAKIRLKEFHLVGNSMGGGIAALYAIEYPEQLKSLLLIDPAGIDRYKSQLIQLFKEGKNPFIIQSQEDFERLMDFAMEKEPFIPWPIISVMAGKAIENQRINDKILADIMGEGSEFVDKFEKINVPTMIMWGSKDRLLDVKNAYALQELIPKSQLTVFEDVGHAPMIEVSEAAAESYKKFLNNLSIHASD